MLELKSMQVTRKDVSPTKVELTIINDEAELINIKQNLLSKFQNTTKVAGFRIGKAPLHMVEKQIDQSILQSQFLDEAINNFYHSTIVKEKLRPIGNPEVLIKKFVPFTSLEFTIEVEVLSSVQLADYKAFKIKPEKVEVLSKDINDVLDNLKQRSATKKAVQRVAKLDDEVLIDFSGVDSDKKLIKGADGSDYPLLLGSNQFIPGFEDNLIGLKTGEQKTFTLNFPKDYGVKALASKKVTFTVKIKTVNQLTKPKLDDDFATTVGPFKTLAELKADIKKQLLVEKQNQAKRQLENDLILKITDKSKLTLPDTLVKEQIDRLKTEVRQNLTYRGQTWQEMLDSQGLSESEYIKQQLLPEAERRVKTGLVLSEISIKEGLKVSTKEIDAKIKSLKDQYSDQEMQIQLAKPEARQEIASRLMTEKTIEQLVQIAQKN